MAEVKADTRFTLQGAALVLEQAVTALCMDASVENMIHLNGAWAYARRVLQLATPVPEPTPPPAVAQRQERRAS